MKGYFPLTSLIERRDGQSMGWEGRGEEGGGGKVGEEGGVGGLLLQSSTLASGHPLSWRAAAAAGSGRLMPGPVCMKQVKLYAFR